MKAEIIAVGTELLMGQIVNTNAQYLSQRLPELGIGVYFQTVVGDNPQRLRQTLEIAAQRADLIVLTGGLGPTQDDLTKDILAEFTGKRLLTHQPSLDKIAKVFADRGQPMAENNARQALVLEDSVPLPNEAGLAVGVALTFGRTHFIVLPGPPREMKTMFDGPAAAWIRSVMSADEPILSTVLKFAGIGESLLEDRLLDLIDKQQDPTIAPYAKDGEVALRLTTRAAGPAEARAKMQPVLAEIRRRLGGHLYAEEDIPIEEAVFRLLNERKAVFATAESCTGGLLADLMTNIPGSSAVFCGGVVPYSNELKHRLLGVPSAVLEGEGAPGAVSAETAKAMADGLLALTGADYAIAVTGVAGPDPSEGKPPGLVYVGIAAAGEETDVHRLQLSGNRETVKLRAAKAAYYQLWKRLNQQK